MQHRWMPRAILLQLSTLLVTCVVSHDAMGLVPWPASFDDVANLPVTIVHARIETITTQPADRSCARTHTATILSNFKVPLRQPEQKLTFGTSAGLKAGHSYIIIIRPGFALYGAPPAFTQPRLEDDYMKLLRCNGVTGSEVMGLVWEVFDDRVEIDVALPVWPEAVPLQKIAPRTFVASRAVLFSYLESRMRPAPAE